MNIFINKDLNKRYCCVRHKSTNC